KALDDQLAAEPPLRPAEVAAGVPPRPIEEHRGRTGPVPSQERPMETATMGRVLTEATIENLEDQWAVKRGLLPADQARRVVIPDALVDTGATLLSLPTRLIQQLGLTRTSSKRV